MTVTWITHYPSHHHSITIAPADRALHSQLDRRLDDPQLIQTIVPTHDTTTNHLSSTQQQTDLRTWILTGEVIVDSTISSAFPGSPLLVSSVKSGTEIGHPRALPSWRSLSKPTSAISRNEMRVNFRCKLKVSAVQREVVTLKPKNCGRTGRIKSTRMQKEDWTRSQLS